MIGMLLKLSNRNNSGRIHRNSKTIYTYVDANHFFIMQPLASHIREIK